MTPLIALASYAFLIAGLFYLARDPKARTSPALWLPVIWMWIACSRAVSQWLAVFGLADNSWSIDSPDQYLDGSPMDRNVLTVLLALGVVVLYRRRHRVLSIVAANWPIVLFFGYCALSSMWSDYTDVALKRWIKAVGNLLMVVIVLTEHDRREAIRRMLSRVGFVLIPISILFIKYYPDLGRGYNPWTWEPFFTGVTDNKNELGAMCLVLGLGAAWSLFSTIRDRKKAPSTKPLIAYTVVIGMVIWLLWIANSMTSLTCFVMSTTLLALTYFHFASRRPVFIHAFVLLAICVSLYALFADTGGGLVQTLGRNPTLTGRTELWHVLLGMTGHPLIGTGFESFFLGKRIQKLWEMFWWHPNEAHNGYLEIYLSLGWIGVTLLGLVLVTGYRNAIQSFKREPEIGRIMLAMFLAATVYNVSEAAFKGMNPIWCAFMLGTVAVPFARIRKTSRARKATADDYTQRATPTAVPAMGALIPAGNRAADMSVPFREGRVLRGDY